MALLLKNCFSQLFLSVLLLCCDCGNSKASVPSQFKDESTDGQDDFFEAAFQGECREDAPCQQLCFDLHDGTFECGCKQGYTLFADGYTCIENSEYELLWNLNLSLPDAGSEQAQDQNRKIFHYALDSKEESNKNDNIQYALDAHPADPRARTLSQSETKPSSMDHSEKLNENSKDNEDNLGESTVVSKDKFNEREAFKSEINFPRDEDLLQKLPDRRHRKKLPTTSNWLQVLGSQDFPASLQKSTPSIENMATSDQPNAASITTIQSTRFSRESSNPVTCEDSPCKNSGTCILSLNNASFKCRCPVGWIGVTCEKAEDVRYPKFKSHSYLALKTRRNPAMSSLKVELEFRPELYEGILFYVGDSTSTAKNTIFFALILRNGIVELRYLGDVRVGILRSDRPVILNSWNTITVFIDETKVWLQLNNGLRPGKQSEGIYPRIADVEMAYLGGFPNISSSAYVTDFPVGFQGCIRQLTINGYNFNFSPSHSEDITAGIDLEECRPVVCNTVSCLNGGQCAAVKPNWGTCLCPLGFGGSECGKTLEIIVPSFDGTAHLQFPGLASSSLTFTEIQIVFSPRSPNGALLYNGYRINGTGDFLSLSLDSGYVLLKFDLGTGANTIRSLHPVSMHEWHNVLITRTGRLGLMQVDDEPAQKVMSVGGYSQLSLPLNLYLGGVPSPKELASGAEVHDSFIGCVQKLVINGKQVKLVEQALSGVNIDNCEHQCVQKPCYNGGTCVPQMDSYKCYCSTGYTGPECKTEIVDMVTRPMFIGNSFLHYVSDTIISRLRGQNMLLSFNFRALSPLGLILWAGSREVDSSSDYLALGLDDGYLRLDYNLGSGPITLFYNQSRVDDGFWHELKLVRYKQRGSITIDGKHTVTAVSPGPLKELNIPNELFLGGMPDIVTKNAGSYHVGFTGCLSSLTLDTDYRLQFLTMAITGISIQPCV